MSVAGGLDVRLPIGGLFTLLGLLIGGYGLATAGDAEHYARSVNVNINLWWGIVMLVFGAMLLLLGTRARRKAAPVTATRSPEGRAIERIEHEEGLERER
jgi:hypothetical protein